MSTSSLADLVARLRRELDSPSASAIRVSGLRGSAPALCLARLLADRPQPVLVVAPDATTAEAFAGDLRFYAGDREGSGPLTRRVHYLPGWDVPPFEPLSPAREIVAARAEGLYHLLQTRDPVIVSTAEALGQRCLPRTAFAGAVTYVVEGETVAPDALADRLIEWGYHRVPLVQDPGDLALRGGILDVFPAGYARPLRFEFVGDDIERLREFDPESQRSFERVEEALLLPVQELGRSRLGPVPARLVDERAAEIGLARQERRELVEAVRSGLAIPGIEFLLPYLYDELATLADYLPPGTLCWFLDAGSVDAAVEGAWTQVTAHAEAAQRDGRFFPPPERLYLDPGSWRALLSGRPRVEVESLEELAGDGPRATTYSLDGLALPAISPSEGPLTRVTAQLKAWQHEGQRLVVVAGGETHRDRLLALLAGHGIETLASGAPFARALEAPAQRALGLVGELSRGVRLPADGLVVVTEAEIFGERRPVRRGRRTGPAEFLSGLAELRTDDFVVHVDHGIGAYRGLRHMQVAGTEGDFLHLEYAGGDRLYVPVDRINVVQRYVSADSAAPALDKLGGTSWERVKAKTKESILAMAHDLVRVYAAREAHTRAPYQEDGLYQEFAARFAFEETPGQQRAIEEVLGDLGGPRPMDRLVCGDVGFGKTEVAMRAAFLAVLAGKQVAVLVPTTILAQQHLETFRARFQGQPVSIDMLSRFRTAAENRETLARIEAGRLDVVIGTHRLLQKDVKFRDLGLLVVDEEHRFGVKDKERIRALRGGVDVLTLTATPIPRTLNMSLSGIRDLSVIETPPVDRLAIRTYVTRYDEAVIRDAVLRELARGGQVFFVHNRVENIDAVASRLGEIVPEARISIAHGQLAEGALEQTMLAFMHGETNVLVTSAIIESGLDIPRANTVVVNRADTFGLAQLYQIRGRVGRSHHRAYAYLLIPGEHLITPDAQKRLRVLQELDDLGGGFRLAAHDLEIRGAGNLLGKQQSGHITAVGLELYTHLLEQAVRELRGQHAEPDIEPEVQLGIPAYVPESYIPDVSQRLVVYKRLAGIRGVPDLEEVTAELEDRYGPVPPLVDTLLRMMELRRWLKDLRVVAARRRGETIVLEFHDATPVTVERLLGKVRTSAGRLRLTSGSALALRPVATDHDALIAELRTLLQSLATAN
ncbi:MAG TPA: transcription-repair coupling factor [Candidatus Binatia bacterium]|nr:transcription-repair coupling factor [Candidatus Binatia bacterium]